MLRRRRFEQLTYDVPRFPAGSMRDATDRFANSVAVLAYGSDSVETWRKRCEASLAASRARRGLR